MKIKSVEDLTLEALQQNEKTRDDDFRLYGAVLRRLDIDLDMSLRDFLKIAKKNDMPALESVPRARRKIFEKYPELQPTQTTINRQIKEQEYKNYSKE